MLVELICQACHAVFLYEQFTVKSVIGLLLVTAVTLIWPTVEGGYLFCLLFFSDNFLTTNANRTKIG